ncbi:MAG: T9SS type A sorting domain-containing protein [Flavobacterium sp.]|nr:T9SS type A sorting domain-containing protein [Flavobacterium sp.]
MKHFYTFLMVLCLISVTKAQTITFSDPKFKAALMASSPSVFVAKNSAGLFIKIDSNNDGEIQVSEAQAVYQLYLFTAVVAQKFSVVDGIEYFTSLTSLTINNELVTNISMTPFSNLKHLLFLNTPVGSLNLTSNPLLLDVEVTNSQLSTLNISGLNQVVTLKCSGGLLTTIDLSSLTALTTLDCSNNQLSSLNCTGLNINTLDCSNNQLSSLDCTGLNINTLNCSNNNLSAMPTGIQNVTYLNVSENPLNSINLSAMPNLYSFAAANCQLSSFSASGVPMNQGGVDLSENLLTSYNPSIFPSLSSLKINDNLLTNLNFSGVYNSTVNCSHNNLTSLNVSNTAVINTLDFSYNPLTSMDFANFNTTDITGDYCNLTAVPNLHTTASISLVGNPFTAITLTNIGSYGDLNFSYCPLLTSVHILNCTRGTVNFSNCAISDFVFSNSTTHELRVNNNQLTTLDLSDSGPIMGYIEASDNPLISMNVKNGSTTSFVTLSAQYICADEAEVESCCFLQNIPSSVVINSYCTFTPGGTFYTIQGNNTFDANGNGCDASDQIFSGLRYNISSSAATGSLISNNAGQYNIPVQAGTHTITPAFENPTYFTVSPPAFTVTFPSAANPYIKNFCIAANGVHPDVEIVIFPVTASSPGVPCSFEIICKNKGNQMASGTITLQFDPALQSFTSAIPTVSNQGTGTLSWNFTDLSPTQKAVYYATFTLNLPTATPPLVGGEILNYAASVSTVQTDEMPLDNVFSLNQIVVNSFDPNDKTCLEGATINPDMAGKFVHYLIRFENTGTANAHNIVVKDMIDTTKFAVSSLVPIDGSGSFTTRITNTNNVEFIFENINLPFDDANNDGYVAFKIKTLPTLVNGDTFSNTASIYFDYNVPIVTNTATTTLAVLGTDDFIFDNYFTLYPNPAKEILNIKAKTDINLTAINIYNTLGQLVLVVPNAKGIESIDVSSLTTGNYFIKITSDKGNSNTRFVKN